jgi:hypothetical protein
MSAGGIQVAVITPPLALATGSPSLAGLWLADAEAISGGLRPQAAWALRAVGLANAVHSGGRPMGQRLTIFQ